MPFEVFRVHQRKLLAVFAILAMIGFVLSDTLPRWINSGGVDRRDVVVAFIDDKPVRLSDLDRVRRQRLDANKFMFLASRQEEPSLFGGATRAEMLDALILEKEADRLGIPETSEFARKWIDSILPYRITAPLFEAYLTRFDNKIGGEQLLIEVASQARLLVARQEIALPLLTPLDVFRSYRDQNEKASFRVVRVEVDSFVEKVGEPSESDLTKLYEEGKDRLPDPSSPLPAFKIPRKIRVESLLANLNEVANRIKPKLTETEIEAFYEGRKSGLLLDSGLPADLFLGEPKLTPPRHVPLSEVREQIVDGLAMERAVDEVDETFENIQAEVLDKYYAAYQEAQEMIAEARKAGSAEADSVQLPKFEDLSAVAAKYGLRYDSTPPIDRAQAEKYGLICRAMRGSKADKGSRFADVFFEASNRLYEGLELADGPDRYLARKVEDTPAHVAPLEQVREEVVHAWKVEHARPVARKLAEEIASKIKAAGGRVQGITFEGRPVLAIEDATKMKIGLPLPSPFPDLPSFQRGPAMLAEINQIPQASLTLIDALFGLKPGDVTVQADKPEENYYVLTIDHRDPVPYANLLDPRGLLSSYWPETSTEVQHKAYTDGIARLRSEHKLRETEEAKKTDPEPSE